MKFSLNKSRFVFLIGLILLLFGCSVPDFAQAIFGIGDIGILDIPALQLDALDFIDNVVLRILIFALLLFVESQILVIAAGKFLDWATGLQVPLNTGLVNSGWIFMVGILNLVIIIIFLVIAFSSILRLDAFQMKRTLPRLVLVALLVNFSSLFVGIFVDIAQVFMNTIKTVIGNNFVDLALESLRSAWYGPVSIGLTALGVKLALAVVPIGNVASALAAGAVFFADLAAGQGWMLQGIVLTVFNFVVGAVFLMFAVLFVARIAVLSMLAMVAPIAFAAAILPGTQKYWNQWLSALLSWSFLGAISLFLMVLGMRLFQDIVSAPNNAGVMGLDHGFWLKLYPYVFLTVYLGVALVISKRFTAVGADMMLAQAKILTGKVRSVGSRLFREGWQRDLGSERGRKMLSRIESFGERIRLSGEKMIIPGGRFVAKWAGSALEIGSRSLMAQVHTITDQQMSSAEKAGKDRNPDDNINDIRLALLNRDWNRVVGLLVATINNGDSDAIRKAVDTGKLEWADINNALRHAESHGNPAYFRPILKGFLDKIGEEGGLIPSRGDTLDSICEKLKPDDIIDEKVDLASIVKTKKGEEVLEKIFLNSDPHVISALLRHPKRAVREWAARYAESKGAAWFIDNRREDVLQAIISSGGRSLGIPLFGGLTQQDIKRMVDERIERLSDEEIDRRIELINRELGELEGRRGKDIDERAYRNRTRSLNTQLENLKKAKELRQKNIVELKNKKENLLQEIKGYEELKKADREAEYYSHVAPLQREVEQIERELHRRRVTDADIKEAQLINEIKEIETRERDIQTQLSQAESPQAVFDSSWQLLEPKLREELRELGYRKTQVELQLRELTIRKIPPPPKPLPKIKAGMPKDLKEFINKGNQEIRYIQKLIREMKESLKGLDKNEGLLNILNENIERISSDIEKINNEENRTKYLSPELHKVRDQLRSRLLEFNADRNNLEDIIEKQKETLKQIRETILERKENFETNIRKQIEDLLRESENQEKE